MNTKAFLAAAVAAALGIGMLFAYMQRFEEEKSGGAPVAVLAARQDIPLGATLSEEMVISRWLPSHYVEARHIRAADLQRVMGVRVSMGVRANESLLWTDLATTAQERRDLSGLVTNGLRAVTISADVTSSFGGLLRPGDRVDVLLTTTRPGANAREKVTVPLLQNTLVLAVGQDTGAQDRAGSARRSARFNQVTLSATVEQAQLLVFAGNHGRGVLSLILRNPDDIAVLEQLPETTRADILEPERRARATRRPPTGPTGPVRILGGQR